MSNEDLCDEELMELYQRGDFAAFETLYQRHSGRIYEYLRRKTSSVENAQELHQEVFSKIHKARDSYNRQYPFLPWIFTIARNATIDFFKQKETQIAIRSEHSPELLGTLTSEANNTELEFGLEQILEKLPLTQRKAIEFRYLQEWSFEEIASNTGTSEDNVRQLISRGLRKLRLYWQQHGGNK